MQRVQSIRCMQSLVAASWKQQILIQLRDLYVQRELGFIRVAFARMYRSVLRTSNPVRKYVSEICSLAFLRTYTSHKCRSENHCQCR